MKVYEQLADAKVEIERLRKQVASLQRTNPIRKRAIEILQPYVKGRIEDWLDAQDKMNEPTIYISTAVVAVEEALKEHERKNL